MTKTRAAGFVVVPLLVLSACGGSPDSVTIYGDGSIGCPDLFAGADEDDDVLPVGSVTFDTAPGEVLVTVVLRDAAPESRYYVEVWSEESCELDQPVGGYGGPLSEFMTDESGAGEIDLVVTDLEPGTHRINVDVVTQSDDLADPRLREIAASAFTEVVVESGVDG